jgi:hypothetical protein
VLAVNRAICFSRLFPVDFWATSDDPNLLWGWAQKYLHRKTRILSTWNNLPAWHKLLGLQGVNKRLFLHRDVVMDKVDETGEGYIGGDGKAPLVPTVIMALGWLHSVGVSKVRIFGADMRGQGHAASPKTISPLETEETRFRWGVERCMMDACMRTYRKNGGRLERWAFLPRADLARS